MPLALAAQAGADDETDVWPGHNTAEPYTLALPPEGATASSRPSQYGEPRVSPGERLRRGSLLVALALAVGAGVRGVPLARPWASCSS